MIAVGDGAYGSRPRLESGPLQQNRVIEQLNNGMKCERWTQEEEEARKDSRGVSDVGNCVVNE